MLQVFLICANFSRLFISAFLYNVSASLEAERSDFRFYDALKNQNACFFSFLAILQYSKYSRFSIVH